MKIFSCEKFKAAEKQDSAWARESDGHIVREEQILGTDYVCCDDDIDRWCIDYTLKPGDKVRIANKRGHTWNIAGKMDHWKGKVMTVDATFFGGKRVEMVESKGENGGENWLFDEADFTEVLTAFDHTLRGKRCVKPWRLGGTLMRTLMMKTVGSCLKMCCES